MTNPLTPRTALALAVLVLAACDETTTEPQITRDTGTPPDFAASINSWITKADMPGTARWGLTTATVTNAAGQSILYAIGGRTSAGGSLGRVQAYNSSTNSWIYRASLPGAA